jgi:hypothetical protein
MPCCPANSCVMGFLTLIPLTASLRSGREVRLNMKLAAIQRRRWCCSDAPFCGRNDFDDARFHSMLVNFVDEALEVAELVHGLHTS